MMYRYRALATPDSWERSRYAEMAVAQCDEALRLNPNFYRIWETKAETEQEMAAHLVHHGQSPQRWLEQAIADGSKAVQLTGDIIPLCNMAQLHSIAAEYAVDAGADPRTSLEQAAHYASIAARMAPDHRCYFVAIGYQNEVEATYLLREGRDPSSALQRAREAFKRSNLRSTYEELLSLRWALKQRKATASLFDNVIMMLKADNIPDTAYAYHQLAAAYEMRARFRAERHQSSEQDINEGLLMADKAIAKEPSDARAHATRAMLYLVKARVTRDKAARAGAARQAKEAFDTAFKENPLLALPDNYGDDSKEAARLLEAH